MSGIPYTHPETGEACSRGEYVTARREANRLRIVAELNAAGSAPDSVADAPSIDGAPDDAEPTDEDVVDAAIQAALDASPLFARKANK